MDKGSSITIGIDLDAAVRGIEAQSKLRERKVDASAAREAVRPAASDNTIENTTRHQEYKGRLLNVVA